MTWIVEFDCGEAILVERMTRQQAWALKDDLGCLPVAVYGPDDGVEIEDLWTKNGFLRVKFRKV